MTVSLKLGKCDVLCHVIVVTMREKVIHLNILLLYIKLQYMLFKHGVFLVMFLYLFWVIGVSQMALYFCSGVLKQEQFFKHYALNVPLYTHFTSPIRRYADIIVHRLLASSLSAYLLNKSLSWKHKNKHTDLSKQQNVLFVSDSAAFVLSCLVDHVEAKCREEQSCLRSHIELMHCLLPSPLFLLLLCVCLFLNV